jgi:hypothetical protein
VRILPHVQALHHGVGVRCEAYDIELTSEAEPDFLPVVNLFTPDAGCTWLLTEIDPDDPDIGFGLCDLGMGYPELGSVSLSELASIRGRLNLPVERDLYFTATKTLSAYADEARAHGAIKAWRRRAMAINITKEHLTAFEALVSGDYRNFALFSCFVNGEPAAAIVAINANGDNYDVTPLFVSITPSLQLADHEGREPKEVSP